MLPELLMTTGPMAWTAVWLEVLEQSALVPGRDTGVTDVITPLVTGLIAHEVLSEH